MSQDGENGKGSGGKEISLRAQAFYIACARQSSLSQHRVKRRDNQAQVMRL
jgi:hypothetical protein